MIGCVIASVAMQQQEWQDRSNRWWKQYAAHPDDEASELLVKRQKLLLLRQAIAAYISIGQLENDIPGAKPDQQDAHKPCTTLQQHHSTEAQQLKDPATAEPDVQPRPQDTAGAAGAQQNVKTGPPSQQHSQEQQQQEDHPCNKACHHAEQQVHDGQQVRPSHKDLLSRLLGPAASAAAGGGLNTAAASGPEQQQQGHLEQHQQQWQPKKRQKPAHMPDVHAHQRQQWPAQTSLQQKRQVQQTGGRRRLLPQHFSNLAQQQQQQQQRQSALHQEQHSSIQQQQQMHNPQHHQQPQQDPWLHMGNQLHDAQSQAVGPAGCGSTAAATGVRSRTCLPHSGAVQALFSPRTADHVPLADRGAWQGSCAVGEQHIDQQGQQHHVLLQELNGHVGAAVAEQHQQLQQELCHIQQQRDESKAPPASPQQLTRADLYDHPTAAAAAPVVIASTPTPCTMVPGTPYSSGLIPGTAGGAAAAAAAAAVGVTDSEPCPVFGSYVAESPAAAAVSDAKSPSAVVAAAAVGNGVAQRLFAAAPVSPPPQREPQLEAAVSPAEVAVAADVAMQAERHQGAVVEPQQQQQSVSGRQPSRKHGASDAKGQGAACAIAAAGAEAHAGRVSRSSSVLLSAQQRTLPIDVGLPVIRIVTCQQQCLVIMQQHSSSNQFELLHLQLQQQQAQQQRGLGIALGGLATITMPEHVQRGDAATAAATALADRGIKLLPLQQSVADNSRATYRSTHSRPLQGALIAAAAPLMLASHTGHHTAAATGAAAAAVTPPGLSVQQQVADRVQAATITPGSDRRSASSDPPTSRRSLRARLSDSSGKHRALLSRLGAANGAAAAGGDDSEHNGVNIYHLSHVAKCDIHAELQQQQQGTVVRVQQLPTDVAVTCLAVCEQQLLLAAAGSAGYACVWQLHHHSNPIDTADHHQEGQQQGPITTAVDADSRVVLPAAAYRGISFPDVTDLCFMIQPGSSSSSVRVLLVGSCSQGSLAVWDVQQQQQIISIHTPDVNIHGLLPLQCPISSNGAVAAGASGSHYCQHQQQQQFGPLLLLALVGAKGSAGAITSPAAAARQLHITQEQLELRPILLQQPGHFILGTPVLGAAQAHRQQHSTAVQSAALHGNLAVAAVGSADHGASVQVWDVVSGRTVLTANSPAAAAARAAGRTGGLGLAAAGEVISVGLMMMTCRQLQQQQQVKEQERSCGLGDGGVMLIGSSSGILTIALL